ncbi:MAG: type II secretion system protein [Nitrospiria bacterium]
MQIGTKGYTLIELITVMVMIGVLTGLAVARYHDLTQEANVSASKGNLGTIRAGITLIHAKTILFGVSETNPEWPSVTELNNNALDASRPPSLANLKIIDGPSGDVCSLTCMPESFISTLGTLNERRKIVVVTTSEANARILQTEAGAWAYDAATGQFYVNQETPNDSRGIPANQW